MHNVGIVVESLDNAIAFFTELGLTLPLVSSFYFYTPKLQTRFCNLAPAVVESPEVGRRQEAN
jgi:hypothetical protein